MNKIVHNYHDGVDERIVNFEIREKIKFFLDHFNYESLIVKKWCYKFPRHTSAKWEKIN